MKREFYDDNEGAGMISSCIINNILLSIPDSRSLQRLEPQASKSELVASEDT
jgi:hypothetical protein